MVGQSRRRGSVVAVSVDRRWDWLLGQVIDFGAHQNVATEVRCKHVPIITCIFKYLQLHLQRLDTCRR